MNYQHAVEDIEQSYLLAQPNDFLAHPATRVERLSQVPPSWSDIIRAESNDDALKKTSPDVETAVASWIAEERDLRLHISGPIGQEVSARIERSAADGAVERLRGQIDALVEDNSLLSAMRVPDCAFDMDICADFAWQAVLVPMPVKAPEDRKMTIARLSRLLRMLPEDDPRLPVRAPGPGRGASTAKRLLDPRNEPDRHSDG